MTETMCHSKVCKEFMDDQFEEVRKFNCLSVKSYTAVYDYFVLQSVRNN